MADVIKMAEDLGKEIAKDAATKRYIALQNELNADPQAQKLLEEYEQQAHRMAGLEAQGQPIEPEDKHKLSRLQADLSGNASVKKFMAAQVEYANPMRKVKQAVMGQGFPAEKGQSGPQVAQ